MFGLHAARSRIAEEAYWARCLDWYDSCDRERYSRTSTRRTKLFFFPRDQNVCRVLVNFANDHSNASALASGEAAFTRSAHLRHREDDKRDNARAVARRTARSTVTEEVK